jgi:hypothetical protein
MISSPICAGHEKAIQGQFFACPGGAVAAKYLGIGPWEDCQCAHTLLPSGTRVQKQTLMVELSKLRILARLNKELG